MIHENQASEVGGRPGALTALKWLRIDLNDLASVLRGQERLAEEATPRDRRIKSVKVVSGCTEPSRVRVPLNKSVVGLMALGVLLNLQVFPRGAAGAIASWVGGTGDWSAPVHWNSGTLHGLLDATGVIPFGPGGPVTQVGHGRATP